MKKKLLIASLLLPVAAVAVFVCVRNPTIVSVNDLPGIETDAFTVDPYIHAAAQLQAAGKGPACNVLLDLAAPRSRDNAFTRLLDRCGWPRHDNEDWSRHNKLIILCRMLFTRKANGEFRRPMIGAANFLGGTDYADWPLEPIEIVDGVPFVITCGYSLAGLAEPAHSYAMECIQNCDWNYEPFVPKTEQEEKHQALDKLLASPKWKVKLHDWEKAFLASQIK